MHHQLNGTSELFNPKALASTGPAAAPPPEVAAQQQSGQPFNSDLQMSEVQQHPQPGARTCASFALTDLPDGALDEMVLHLDLATLRNLRATCRSLCNLVDQRRISKLHFSTVAELPPLQPSTANIAVWAASARRSFLHITQLQISGDANPALSSSLMHFIVTAAPSLTNLRTLNVTASAAGGGMVLAVLASLAAHDGRAGGGISSPGALPYLDHVTICSDDEVLPVGKKCLVLSDSNSICRLVGQFSSLRRLELDAHLPISHTSAAAKLTALTSLSANIEGTCIPAFRSLRSLRLLSVLYNATSYACLSFLTNLQHLEVPFTYQPPSSEEVEEDVMDEEGFEQLVAAVPLSLRSLRMPDSPPWLPSGACLGPFTALSRLTNLDTPALDITFDTLRKLPSLVTATFADVSVSGDAVPMPPADEWGPPSALRELECNCMHLYERSLPTLWPNLVRLSIDGLRVPDVELVNHLEISMSLAVMFDGVSFAHLCDASLPLELMQPAVCRACHALTSLSIICTDADVMPDFNGAWVDRTAVALAALTGLADLQLQVRGRGSDNGDAVMQALSIAAGCGALPLCKLVVSMPCTPAGWTMLGMMPHLTHVTIKRDPTMCEVVMLMLAAMPNLVHLEFQRCLGVTSGMAARVQASIRRRALHISVLSQVQSART